MLVNVQYIYRFFSNAIKGESTKSTDRIFLLMMVNCRDFNFIYIYVHIHIYIYISCVCAVRSSSYQLRMQTYRLCNRVGLKSHSSLAPARHLDYEHPQVQAVRTFIAQCEEQHNINKRLIANFDQVWTTTYRHQRRVLHKEVEACGKHTDVQKPSIQKMMKAIRIGLRVENGELELEDESTEQVQGYSIQHPSLNAPANVSPIENWRFPRTTTTLSWSDGELGASWITVKDGTAPDDMIRKLNEELAGILEIHTQDSKSHMWSSGTMLSYLQFLSTQLRLRRMKLKLTPKDGLALIICDKATVHSCQAFESLRQRWQQENHALIIHGSTEDLVKVPPGWGATGAPNDGWHQFFHLLRQSFQKVASKQGRHLKIRSSLDELDLAVDGSVRFTILSMLVK